jgi:hypothetical protein
VYSVKKKSYAKTRNGSVKRLIRGDDEVHATPFALLASWVSSSQRQRAQHHRVRVRKPQQLGGESKTAASEAQVGRPANGSAPSYVQWLPAGARCRDRAPTRSATGLERRWWPGDFRVCMLAVVRCTMDGWAPTHQSGDEEEDDAHHVCVAVLF